MDNKFGEMLVVLTVEVGNDLLGVSIVLGNEVIIDNRPVLELKDTVVGWLTRVLTSMVDELRYDCDGLDILAVVSSMYAVDV